MVLEKPASAGFFSPAKNPGRSYSETLTRRCCFLVFFQDTDGPNLCSSTGYRECSGSWMIGPGMECRTGSQIGPQKTRLGGFFFVCEKVA